MNSREEKQETKGHGENECRKAAVKRFYALGWAGNAYLQASTKVLFESDF